MPVSPENLYSYGAGPVLLAIVVLVAWKGGPAILARFDKALEAFQRTNDNLLASHKAEQEALVNEALGTTA